MKFTLLSALIAICINTLSIYSSFSQGNISSPPPPPVILLDPVISKIESPSIKEFSSSSSTIYHLKEISFTVQVTADYTIESVNLLWSINSDSYATTTPMLATSLNDSIYSTTPILFGEVGIFNYRVEVIDEYGSLTILEGTRNINISRPNKPTYLKPVKILDRSIQVKWRGSNYSEWYRLSLSTDSDFSSTLIEDTTSISIDESGYIYYTVDGLPSDTDIFFRVRGENSYSVGDYHIMSSPDSCRTLKLVSEPLLYPLSTTVSSSSIAQLSIDWTIDENSVSDSILVAISLTESNFRPDDYINYFRDGSNQSYSSDRSTILYRFSSVESHIDLVGLPYDTQLSITLWPYNSSNTITNYKTSDDIAVYSYTISSANRAIAWINELHYKASDNSDFFEVIVRDLDRWDIDSFEVLFYNGSNDKVTNSWSLSGRDIGVDGDFSIFLVDGDGELQDGTDGLSITYEDRVLDFITWGGSSDNVTPIDGKAVGVTPVRVPIKETSSDPSDSSLQLIGEGRAASDFIWSGPTPYSKGVKSSNQELISKSVTVWTGGVDSDWYSGLNWSSGVPIAESDIVIEADGEISIPDNTLMGDIYIGEGAEIYSEENIPLSSSLFITIPYTVNRWSFISSPLSNFNVSNIDIDSGALYLIDYIDSEWQFITDKSHILEVGEGRAVRVTEGDEITISGALFRGELDIQLDYNSEAIENWNLLGNPYLSSIEWSELYQLNAESLDNSAYIYDSSIASYITFSSSGVSSDGRECLIAPYSAFFVESLSLSSVDYILSNNSSNLGISQRSIGRDQFGTVTLSISSDYGEDFYTVAISNVESDRVDSSHMDSKKLLSISEDNPQIYGVDSSMELSIDFIDSLPTAIPINILSPKIDFIDVKASFTGVLAEVDITALLEDSYNSCLYNLIRGVRVPIKLYPGDNSDRFKLHIFRGDTPEYIDDDKIEALTDIKVINEDWGITVLFNEFTDADITIYDMRGRAIYIEKLRSEIECTFNLGRGVYILTYRRVGEQQNSLKVVVE